PCDGRRRHDQAIRVVGTLDHFRRITDERQGLKLSWYTRQGGLAIRIIAFAASLNDIDLVLLLGHGCFVLAEKFDAVKRLGEGHTSLLADLGIVCSCIRLALCPRTLHLASVAVERIHLDGESVSDIEKSVWLLGAPKIDFPDFVGLQTFLQ